MTRLRWKPRVGIALGADRLVALLPRRRTLETTDVADLKQVFKDLRARSGVVRATVYVALVPPLVEVRTLKLPPLRESERQRVLERDVQRYFVGSNDPLVIGSQVAGEHIVAAVASAAVVSDVEEGLSCVGWTLAAVMPAHAAWAAGVRDGQVVVRLAHTTEVLRIATGRLVERRRFRMAPANDSTISDPFAIAARNASAAAGPELLSTDRRARRVTVARRVVRGLWSATAACTLLAAGLDYWGVERTLAQVQAQRAAIAPQVTRAMTARDSLASIASELSSLQQLSATSPRWSTLLADLADFLPRDGHLMSLRAYGDSAVLEGVAKQAAGVFEALQQMPHVAGVRAGAPVQRDVLPDGSLRERFALNAWLRWTPESSP